jgi:hypothetical protein
VDVVTATSHEAYEEVPFSELLHRPAATASRLDTVRALRLRRRDAADLALVRADQVERDSAVILFTAALLGGLVRHGNRTVVRGALIDALPWTTFLPDDDLELFVTELIKVASGAAVLENLAPIAQLLIQWRHSAEIYADPALRHSLIREPEGDLGPVPRPGDADG